MTSSNGLLRLVCFITVFVIMSNSVIAQESTAVFSDLTNESGLRFTHFNGMQGKLLLPEIMGSGAALFDYDNDGDLDVFLVQGSLIEGDGSLEGAIYPWKEGKPPKGRLFRNDLSNGKVRFTDVTESSGINAEGYGIGVAVGDVNRDGFDDIYLLNLRENKLFLNSKSGKFRDATKEYGVGDAGWGVSASFLDMDGDGWLDLFVGNYGVYEHNKVLKCYSPSTERDYCGPRSYPPAQNVFYRNESGNKFTDVSETSGILKENGHTLGVAADDVNGDGLIDIYVANDGDPNHLWINKGNGKFENDAFFAGVAVNGEGMSEASMGVDIGDFNLDGKPDLFVTHLMEETHTLYSSQGDAIFEDITIKSRINQPDSRLTGFGTRFFDYDNDGFPDIFVANGSVKLLRQIIRPGNTATLDPKYPLGQNNQLFRNLGDGRFEDVSSVSGEVFKTFDVSRGAAFGDIDNDGDIDILVSNNSGSAVLMRNEVGSKNPWVGIVLSAGSMPLEGTTVKFRSSEKILSRTWRTDGSYASASDPRIIFAAGATERFELEVRWTDGSKEVFSVAKKNSYNTLVKGKGKSV